MPWTIIVTVYWLAITHTIMSSNRLIRAASVHKWEILFHWITDHAGWLTSLHGAAPIDHDSSVFQTQAVILHLFICHTTSQEKWVMHWFAVYAWLRECKGERERKALWGAQVTLVCVETELAVLVGLCAAWGFGDGWKRRWRLGSGGPPQHPQTDRLARLVEQLRGLLLATAVQPLSIHLISSDTHIHILLLCHAFLFFHLTGISF